MKNYFSNRPGPSAPGLFCLRAFSTQHYTVK